MAMMGAKIIFRPFRFFILMAAACLASGLLAETCRAGNSQAENSQASATQALELNCAQMLQDTIKLALDKDRVIVMQQRLIFLEYNPEWVDGILGPRTESALRQFCERAKFSLDTDLLTMLQNHVAIANKYPHWKQTLASGDFGKWADGQPDADEIGRTKLSGSPTDVIALLDRYRKRKDSVPVVRVVDDVQVSYVLTKENFDQLRAKGKIFKLMAKLQGKTFSSKQDFETAVEAALKDVAEPEKYVKLALKYAEMQPSRTLSDESFNNLKVEPVPAYILQPLLELKNLNYPLNKIDDAVKTALGGLADKVSQFDPGDIVALAEVSKSGTVKFTAASVKKFADAHKDDPAAAVILTKLQKLQDIEYQSVKTMTAAMKNVLKQAAAQVNGFQQTVLAATVETVAYGLSETSMLNIDRQLDEITIPEFYLEMLGGLQGVEYPDPKLFWQATTAKVSMAGSNNIWRVALFGALEKESADQVDDALLEKLRAEKLPPALITSIGSLKGKQFANAQALENAVALILNQKAEEYEQNEQYRSLLVSVARKTHPFDETKVIEWDGESCNCVHDNLAGDVYGFYPYWMAGGEQVIDFSVQTRFGFYALDLDDKGNIVNTSQWSGQNAGFIREARTYGSKVDLVLHKDDWERWERFSAAEKKESFEKLTADIVKLLNIPLPDLTSTLVPYVSLGMSRHPVMGDGVTLYFEGYPRDAESVDTFIAFIRNLAKMLQAQNRHQSVNIMFRSSEIGTGIYDYQKLLDIMDMLKKSELGGLYAVLLREPTTGDKKLLRLNIENGLHGEKRVTLLRNVTTVITYDGQSERQLKDDVIYAKDNFGGIGFWPQPMMAASSVSGAVIGSVLHQNYMDDAKQDVPGMCKYVCPHKWTFRITFGTFFLAMLAAVFMRFLFCPWRVLFDQHFLHFIAGLVVPTFLLGLALLFCDPGLDDYAKGHAPLIFVILGIIGYSIWNYHDKKSNADLP